MTLSESYKLARALGVAHTDIQRDPDGYRLKYARRALAEGSAALANGAQNETIRDGLRAAIKDGLTTSEALRSEASGLRHVGMRSLVSRSL